MRAWLLALTGLVIVYGPHVWWAEWVYEDLAWIQAASTEVPDWWSTRRGLTRLAWWTQWHLSPTPVLFHAVSVGVHVVASMLVWQLARRVGVERGAASVALVVMALHPMTRETVAYAAQQGELVAAIGVLGACLLAAGRWWRPHVWMGIAGCIALGLAGKETAIVALALVPLIIWVRQVEGRPLWAARWLPAVLAAEVLVGGIRLVGGWVTVVNAGEAGGVRVGALEWLLVQSAAVVRSLWLLVVPIGPFTVDYDYDAVGRAWQWASLATLIGLAGGAWALRHRWPFEMACLVAMLIVIVPRLIVQTPRSYFNDHQAYLLVPSVALIAAGVYDRWRRTS